MSGQLSISEAALQIRSRRLEPQELVERCLDRITRYEDRVRAWVLVDADGARRTAQAMGEEAARGEFRGPLHGIPLGIKDIVDVAGVPTRAGSPLRENHIARADAPLVNALRRAGAIVLGKTVTVEFACFDPSPTRNPWDPALKRSPGGSSSGSAVAVALGMCLGAIGTQTGGSLVRPASYCGIAACKPTFGRVDRTGIVPVSWHLDHVGPMARTVADLEIILRHLPQSRDFGPPVRENEESPSWDGTRPPRLGLVEEFFMEEAETPIREAMETALAKLCGAGATIVPVALPKEFAHIIANHGKIMGAEAAAYHRGQFAAHRQSYGPMITSLLDEGLAMSAVDYADALGHRAELQARIGTLFEGVDALIMPATDTTAPATLGTTGSKRFQAPWSYAGVPVVSLPCGLASDQMPAAVQLAAAYHHDAVLLRVAEWCEERLAFSALPPVLA